MQTLIDIWQGWLQFGVGDTTRWLYFTFDVLFVALALFFVIRAFNSKKNINYLGLIGLALGILVLSAYITLPGLHVLAQFGLILLVVGLPLFLDDRWVGLFGQAKTAFTSAENPYLNPFLIGVVSIFSSLLIVGLASGIGAKTAELPTAIPLTAVNLPEGMSASFGSQVSARVIVSAETDRWRSLDADNFSATVDVAAQGEGTYDLPIVVSSKATDVKVVRVNPSHVVATVEPIIRKTVSVVTKFSGKAGNELIPDEPTFNPTKVEASGPKSALADLTQAVIQVKLNGEVEKIVQTYSLVALTSSGEVIGSISFTPSEVEVTINLVKAGNLKTVGIRPITTGQPAGGHWIKSITLDPLVVSVTGPVDQLAALTEVTTEPISVAGVGSDTTLSTTLALPSGITIADSTTKIRATLDIEETSATKTINPEFEYDGLSAGLKVGSISPTAVATLASGTSGVLAALADHSVKIKINLSPYQSPGTYSVVIKSANFIFPEGVGLVSYLPSVVTVVLENL